MFDYLYIFQDFWTYSWKWKTLEYGHLTSEISWKWTSWALRESWQIRKWTWSTQEEARVI